MGGVLAELAALVEHAVLDHLVRAQRSDCGIARPSALAVLRLMISIEAIPSDRCVTGAEPREPADRRRD